MIRPSAQTRLYVLLGDPVAHSLSPALHNAAFEDAGLDAVYLAVRCDGVDAPTLLRGIARAGGGGNVTVPHKERAAAALDRATETVARTGACNTFWLEEGRIIGDNTDVAGFTHAAADLLGTLAGTRVLVLGAGGAASAVLCALIAGEASEILLLNRTRERADALLARYRDGPVRLAPDVDQLRGQHFDLVVNATSLGMRADDRMPLELSALGSVGAALDLVYGPTATPWVRSARELGVPAADGSAMLLAQAAEAFRCWTGRDAPFQSMRVALNVAVKPESVEGEWE